MNDPNEVRLGRDGPPNGDSPLVSVILPVFNAEQHLQTCLESIFAQTLAPLEILAVDDGSTDRSPAILSAAAQLGPLRVLTMVKNGGVSAARNAGLAAARGEFVAFVDADDVVATTMYEELYRTARETKADIVYCGIRVVRADGAVLSTEPPPLTPGQIHASSALHEVLHEAWRRKLLWYPIRSVYRRSLLDANDIRFDEGIRKGEDSLFNLQVLSLAPRVTAVSALLYNYRKHPSSATARPLESESDNLERLDRAVTAVYKEHGFNARAFDDFYLHVLSSDLPTAIVRLRWHATPRREIDALLNSPTVRKAFATQKISALQTPTRVRAILLLARYRCVRLVVIALRTLVRT